MAKIVIAGSADCPYYAKVEILADDLVKNLPDFKLHKLVIKQNEWEGWLEKTCTENGWVHKRSPLVWRELVNRGGKGTIIGGANDFQEYANSYYNKISAFKSEDMTKIATENTQTKTEVDEELEELRLRSHPLHICLTSAINPVCYNMIKEIAQGEALGHDTEISIRLFDMTQESLKGVEMEGFDLAMPLLKDIQFYSNVYQAFADCSVVVLLDEVPRDPEESENEWLKRNHRLFAQYGRVLNEVAKPDVKVLVAGYGPLNFNTHTIIKNAPNLLRQNIAALSRVVENSAKSLLSQKLKVNSANVVDSIVWGNINKDKLVDVSRARVHQHDGAIWGPPSFSLPLTGVLTDNKWLTTEFQDLVIARQNRLEEEMKHRPCLAEASAVVSLIKHWHLGSPPGQFFSLGVCSEGEYEVPEGLVFSYPVTFHPKGYWIIVEDINISEEIQEKIKEMSKSLVWEIGAPTRPDVPSFIEESKSEVKETESKHESRGSSRQSKEGSQQGEENEERPASKEGEENGEQRPASKEGQDNEERPASKEGEENERPTSKDGEDADKEAEQQPASGEDAEKQDEEKPKDEEQETKEETAEDEAKEEQAE